MLDFKSFCGLIAGVISIICFIPYIITTIKGKTRPNIATWSTWLILSIVISASYYSAGAFNTLWVPVCSILGQSVIVLLALKKGEGSWSKFDKLCLFCVGLSLALWWHFNSPMIALIMSLIVDFFGILPTIKKSYQDPESENLLTWVLYLVTSIFLILAIETWSFALSSFPIYMLTINIIIVFLLIRNKINYKMLKMNNL
ncbi:hypothetical protein NIES4102_12790 [Chondrocystis sp. NIES-4102]|nr:hypothetical protein NIES4102_12790 [Chondrocystis sp. NIES-4102]